MIKNPVLQGFYPDPVICYINNSFYIANSTFEYYPGVTISKSEDLANWKTVSYPLKHNKHMNLIGIRNSCGIWAPCLSHCDGISYLVYTEVRSFLGENNCKNYITYTDDIDSDNWSEPIFINSLGFDPSLFHDTDGKKYFISMDFGYEKENNFSKFLGILITELHSTTLKPIGKTVKIYEGEYLEGIHIYKKDGYYYLIGANGGTSYQHCAVVARSKNIYGEYKFKKDTKYLITTKNDKNSYLQKVGHGSICEDKNGRWWLAFLSARPLGLAMGKTLEENKNCPLGRETSISEIKWVDGWPYLKNGGIVPSREFLGYDSQKNLLSIDYNFDDDKFLKDFQNLRQPAHYEILENGYLRLFGKENIKSTYFQNMFVTRQHHFNFEAITSVTNKNKSSKVMGGLLYRYSENNQYYLQFTYDEKLNKNVLEVIEIKKSIQREPFKDKKIIIHNDTVHLKLIGNYDKAMFYYSIDGKTFEEINYLIDVNMLSDENDEPIGFTGGMIGMVAQDLEYDIRYCDFGYFKYRQNCTKI